LILLPFISWTDVWILLLPSQIVSSFGFSMYNSFCYASRYTLCLDTW
jgi:hypothetical protein